MSAASDERDRVSTLELFFDLVFVFTITQLTGVLAHHPDGEHLLQVALMLTVIWWMYGGFVWLTNAVATDTTRRRLLLLGGMACFMVISLSIPTAFSGDGEIFAGAYLAVILVHAALFTRSWNAEAARAILTTVRFNLAAALLILAGALIGDEPWEYILWGLGALAAISTTWLQDSTRFRIQPSHFVERHGLVVIVALGESVVAVGIGASGQELTAGVLGVAVAGLALSAALWWSYFEVEDEAGAAFAAVPDEHRAQQALTSYYFAHLLLLGGVIAVAAGLEEGIAHPYDTASLGIALCLSGGAAAYFAGEVAFRRSLGIAHGAWLGVAGLVALATVPLGTAGSALLQLVVLLAAVVACLVAEAGSTRRLIEASPEAG
ncbi:MAG TPA: low temperature requirement protein A [Solirubrobacterales bacterium]|jgi:low temperature requirement protein LtrA|nr:low temperature requirement protein A [Solirubrobacterales bacterium]